MTGGHRKFAMPRDQRQRHVALRKRLCPPPRIHARLLAIIEFTGCSALDVRETFTKQGFGGASVESFDGPRDSRCSSGIVPAGPALFALVGSHGLHVCRSLTAPSVCVFLARGNFCPHERSVSRVCVSSAFVVSQCCLLTFRNDPVSLGHDPGEIVFHGRDAFEDSGV